MRHTFWSDCGSCLINQAGCLILLHAVAALEDATRTMPMGLSGLVSTTLSSNRYDRRPPC